MITLLNLDSDKKQRYSAFLTRLGLDHTATTSMPVSGGEVIISDERLAAGNFIQVELPEQLTAERFRTAVHRALAEADDLRNDFRTCSTRLSGVFEEAKRFAAYKLPILIEGETGTGKSYMARAIHNTSALKDQPFLAFNCSRASGELVDSMLFGHAKGSFTGAVSEYSGLFRAADGGTVFLDEVDALPLPVQAKLLTFLDSYIVQAVGSTKEHHVELRLICATNSDLYQRVEEGTFRKDLLYRIDVAKVRQPSLREIPEDLPGLIKSTLHQIQLESDLPIPLVSPAAWTRLLQHSWPGNLRELRHVLVSAMLRAHKGQMEPHHLAIRPTDSGSISSKGSFAVTGFPSLEAVEQAYVTHIMEHFHDGNLERTAQALGISRKTLYRKRLQCHEPISIYA